MMNHDSREYMARSLILPGLVLMPGDYVMIVDSRGRVLQGVFRGYRSSFIALSRDCNEHPSRFLNIKRINEIWILKVNYCGEGEGGKEIGGNDTNSDDNR